MAIKINPKLKKTIDLILVIVLSLYVILPDPFPIFVDDLVALILAIIEFRAYIMSKV